MDKTQRLLGPACLVGSMQGRKGVQRNRFQTQLCSFVLLFEQALTRSGMKEGTHTTGWGLHPSKRSGLLLTQQPVGFCPAARA